MNRIIMTLLITASLLGPRAVQAHDASLHKGKATVGEIMSLGNDRFDLKTATGTIPVTYSSKTKFEHGKATVDKTHLQTGENVSVFGTKLPNGDLVAKEILIGASATDESSDHSKMDHDAKTKADHKH